MTKVNYNAILIRIPRTGTGTIGYLLGVEDSHKTAKDMIKEYGTLWNDAFTFAFVRNPYTRFQSCYVATGIDLKMDINDFLEDPENFKEAMKEHAVFFRPQVDYLLDDKGEQLVDFIGRFEKLEEHWNIVAGRIKNYKKTFPHLHRTDRPHQELTPASKDILYQIYEEDFEMFDYKRYNE